MAYVNGEPSDTIVKRVLTKFKCSIVHNTDRSHKNEEERTNERTNGYAKFVTRNKNAAT